MNTPGLHPVEDRTLRAQVTRQILDRVMAGDLEPGARLTETMLAKQLNVSRAPLREALRELVDRGILVSQAYRSLHVRQIGARELTELFDLRAALEQFAFRKAWSRRDVPARADLGARYDRLIAAQLSGDVARSVAAQIDFHGWVHHLADNALLADHWNRLTPLIGIYMSLHHRAHGSHGEFHRMARDYVRLALGDSEQAMQDHLVAHMREGRDAVLAIVGGDQAAC